MSMFARGDDDALTTLRPGDERITLDTRPRRGVDLLGVVTATMVTVGSSTSASSDSSLSDSGSSRIPAASEGNGSGPESSARCENRRTGRELAALRDHDGLGVGAEGSLRAGRLGTRARREVTFRLVVRALEEVHRRHVTDGLTTGTL